MSQGLLVGIEIGGTKLQLGLGRGDGQILALERRTIRPKLGADGILDQIQEAYKALLQSPEAGGDSPVAVGIGYGGPVDAERGVTTCSHQVTGWENFPLADWARRHLGVDRVSIQNDADTAGLGEACFGAGVGFSSILYVTIGSGIGGGLILDQAIYRGCGAGATEIGHLWVDTAEGLQLLESIASGWSIGRTARSRLGSDDVTAITVARMAEQGDPICQAILSDATRSLGIALAHAVTLLAPRRIILGGGVSLMPDILWLDPIRLVLDQRVFAPFRGCYDVVAAALGESVVIHGAIALALAAALQNEQEPGIPPRIEAKSELS